MKVGLVEARVTGAALKETFAELLLLAEKGPTAAEVKKARATARGDQVEQWSSVAGAAQRLATLAALGLAAQRDRVAVVARDGLGMEEIQRAAALIVAAGDAATILPQLRDLGLPEAVRVDAEGRPL
jgi:predicted Zn-dependent peptidase